MQPIWKPHDPILVEQTWNAFVPLMGGRLISAMIAKTPEFENADYLFETENVIIELKEIETDFGRQTGINERVKALFGELTQ